MRVLGPASVLLYVIFQSIRVCTSGAVLKARMVSFHNPYAIDEEDDPCDYFSSGCDHYFMFYFDEYRMTTRRFTDTYVIRFGKNMNGVNNPFVMRFHQWKGSIRMRVKIMDDDDGYSSNDLVDNIYYTYKGIPGPTSGSPNIQHHNLRGSRRVIPTTLSVTFELYCEPNFYGTACDVECVPRDDDRGHFTCDPDTGHIVCMEGWEGESCNVSTDNCQQHGCQNGATCRDGDNSYSCICPDGFSGRFCESDIDECSSAPCYNGATCRNLPGRFVCECPRSFTGPFCQHDICVVKNPCRNGGSCYDDGKCFCPPGYTGKKCTENKCDVIKCANGGTCVDGVCICTPGFLGTNCQVDACVYKECYNGGVCQRGCCICRAGFRGSGCELNINDCESQPCQHMGHCVDRVHGYKCLCQKPYSGINCEVVTITESPESKTFPYTEKVGKPGQDFEVVSGTESPKSETFPYAEKEEMPDIAKCTEKPQDVYTIQIAVSVTTGVLLIAMVALLVCFLWRKKRRQNSAPPGRIRVTFDSQTITTGLLHKKNHTNR